MKYSFQKFAAICISMSFLISHIKTYAETKPMAKWTIIVYMAADNNLYTFALNNIQDMAKGIIANTDAVNVLVQLDKPEDNKTWRYKITQNTITEDESVSTEMGIDPVKELIACATWAYNKYPAENYVWILWNHGSGIQDIKKNLNIFDFMTRGILYDDSQGTLLTNEGLTNAFTAIKSIMGKPAALICMDACLMAMVEVAYQLKGLASILVGSEQIEPGSGYPYQAILSKLTSNPSAYDAKKLASTIVKQYGAYYNSINEKDYTSSAFDISYIGAFKENIDTIATKVATCKKYGAQEITKAIIKARRNTLSFYVSDYIDLYCFYANLKLQLTQIVKKLSAKTAYAKAINDLISTIDQGMNLITTSIIANAAGEDDIQAHGIAIYYLDPYKSATLIDKSYPQCLYAQQTAWLNFMKENRY